MIIRNTSDFGAAVRSLRKQQGLTQQELANAAGCSIMYLSALERGKETAEIGIALRIMNMLACDLETKKRGGR